MTSWQEHPVEELPEEFYYLGERQELEEEPEEVIGASRYRVFSDGTVEYKCERCGNFCVRNIEEPCVHHGECLPCYIDGNDADAALAESDVDTSTMPPEVPWVEMVQFRCVSCKEWCLAWRELDCVQAKECRECYAVPDLDRAPPLSEMDFIDDPEKQIEKPDGVVQ